MLVGAGRWGKNHLRVLLKLQAEGRCSLVGVQTRNPKNLKRIAKEFGVRTFSDDKGLAEADAVDIVVPTRNHFAVAKKALLAGKDVLIENPLTTTLADAEELEKINANSSQVLMVGHLFRYNPAVNYAKKLLTDKKIGKIRFLRGRFMGFRFKDPGAGILTASAIHFIYLSNYFMGRLPKAVSTKADYLLDSTLDDHCLVRLDYGPEFSLIEADFFTPGKFRTFDIIGTEGSIFLDALNEKVDLYPQKHVQVGDRFEAEIGKVLNSNIKTQEPLYLELRHFLECVQERKEPLTGIKDGIAVLQIIESAYESSHSDRTILLSN